MSDILNKAKWIECDKKFSAPIVIKKFFAEKAQTAKIYIFGLGYYEAFLNGERVGEDFYKPVVSDYAPRDYSHFGYPTADKTTQRVYYNVYELQIKKGENTLAVMLGNGFFRQTRRFVEGNTSFGDKLILSFAIDLKEGVIFTDGSESCLESFIVENNVFYGETHDYLGWTKNPFDLENFSNLKNAESVCVIEPTAVLTEQKCPSDRIERIIKPSLVIKKGEKSIYDVGENITGFVRLIPLSQTLTITHAEVLKGDELAYSSTGDDQIQKTQYKNAVGRRVHPWFHWSGFRYFEVEGDFVADELEVVVVHTRVSPRLKFKCGNAVFNWLVEAYLRTQKSALHGGITMDCPHRERLGYTGDGQLVAESAMLTLDCKSVFEKWMQDIADCQDILSGHVQHTAPFMGGGGGPGGWGSAVVIVPYAHYKLFGDKQILKKYFKNMQNWLVCMRGFCENGLVVREREGGWCLGDWCAPQEIKIPAPLVNTFYFVRCLEIFDEICNVLGEPLKPFEYSEWAKESKNAIIKAYYDENSGEFCNNEQGANVFGLLLGLGDERTKTKTLQKYRTRKFFDTGIMGTDLLCEWLVKEGEEQLLFDMLVGENFPSFGYMRANGATTLWEGWRNDGSLSHPMLGSCIKHIVYGILGVKADVGFKNVSLQPKFIDGIGFIDAELCLEKVTLKLKYEYKNGKVIKTVNVIDN